MPHKRSPRYGWKFNHAPGPPLVENRGEQTVIRFIFDRRRRGLGFRAIARELDELWIPPRQGRGHQWDHSVIRSILQRESASPDATLDVGVRIG